MFRQGWHGVVWGGVGMLMFVSTCFRHGFHGCYADHGVGWGGVGVLTFVSTCITCITCICIRMSPKMGHVDPLAMQRLLDKPGLKELLTCLSLYRHARANLLGYHPRDFADLTKDKAWLEVWKELSDGARTPGRNLVGRYRKWTYTQMNTHDNLLRL